MQPVRFNQKVVVHLIGLKHFALNSLAVLAVLAAASGNAAGQSIYGGIRGLVTDPASAAIANAKVTLTNEGTSAQRSGAANSLGEYLFNQVIPGTYTES